MQSATKQITLPPTTQTTSVMQTESTNQPTCLPPSKPAREAILVLLAACRCRFITKSAVFGSFAVLFLLILATCCLWKAQKRRKKKAALAATKRTAAPAVSGTAAVPAVFSGETHDQLTSCGDRLAVAADVPLLPSLCCCCCRCSFTLLLPMFLYSLPCATVAADVPLLCCCRCSFTLLLPMFLYSVAADVPLLSSLCCCCCRCSFTLFLVLLLLPMFLYSLPCATVAADVPLLCYCRCSFTLLLPMFLYSLPCAAVAADVILELVACCF